MIKSFLDLSDKEVDIVNGIFFETSARTHFSSKKDKEEFQYKYLDYYKIYYPQYFFVFCDPDPVGYICGIPNTLKEKKLFELNLYLHAFRTKYKKFPAHLHINFTAETRGKGLGGELIDYYAEILREEGVVGLHIITNPKAKNVQFYEKHGFHEKEQKTYKGVDLLFMGKSL